MDKQPKDWYDYMVMGDISSIAGETYIAYSPSESEVEVTGERAECHEDKCRVCGGDRYVMFEGKSLPCGRCNFQVQKERDWELPKKPDYHVVEGGRCYLNARYNLGADGGKR